MKLAKFNFTDSTVRLSQKHQQLVLRSLRGSAMEPAGLAPLLEQGVVLNEVLKALIRKGDEYEAHGLRVVYKGLD